MKAIVPQYLHLRRLFFRLRHTTAPDVMAAVRAAAPRETLSRAALASWIERAASFGESAVKLPIEMTLAIEPRVTADSRAHDADPPAPFGFVPTQPTRPISPFGRDRTMGQTDALPRAPRWFRPAATPEITRVERRGDLLFQDTHVPAWHASDSLRIDELDGARLRLRVAWLSFDDVNLRQPPRFSALRLHFETSDAPRHDTRHGTPPAASPLIIVISPARLASPRVGLDPAPRLRGPFFKTLLLEYHLMVALSPSRFRSVPARPARIRAQPRRHFEEEERTTCCFMH